VKRPPKSTGKVSNNESSNEELQSLRKQLRQQQREYKSVLRNAETYEEIAENGKRLLMQAQEQLEQEIRGHRCTEAALRLAKSEAEVGSETKSRFLATMSHEMRTPLNGIIGMLELLLRTSLDNSQQNLTRLAQNSARTLVLLINQLLDFSKMEAGRMELNQTPFNLRSLIEDLLSLEASQAHLKGLHVCGVVDHTIPTQLLGDGHRLRQVLLNLINNAIKHTETGEVLLRVRRLGVNGPLRLSFEVFDTGTGIPEADRKQLFEPFTQADSSTTRAFEGTGLGLAISHRLVEMLGGSLKVESKVGTGSRFFFDLPFLESPYSSERTPNPFLLGQTIGIVDRHTALVEQVRTIIEPLGGTVCSTESLEEAQRMAASTNLLALLVSNDLVDSLQHLPEGPHILPMAYIGTKFGEETERMPLLMKPLRASRLVEILLLCMTNDLDRANHNNPNATLDYHKEVEVWKARVLVVDDNDSNLLVARLLLEQLGCSVDTTNNSIKALELVQHNTFDMIFMDCSMPEVDGYDATRKIRIQETPNRRNIIIAMTAYALSGDRQRCLEAGMDDYLSKPIDLAAIREVLSRNLGAPTSNG
jgi:signal transduction histidine kinase/CheY-like chemotaxis protein